MTPLSKGETRLALQSADASAHSKNFPVAPNMKHLLITSDGQFEILALEKDRALAARLVQVISTLARWSVLAARTPWGRNSLEQAANALRHPCDSPHWDNVPDGRIGQTGNLPGI
jgi:hypothetical protein